MIYYEHEVMTFGTQKKKDIEAMSKTLNEWGAAGYEVVSVVPTSMSGDAVNVFLKRKVFVDEQDEGKAA